LVKSVFGKRLIGSKSIPLPQDQIIIYLSDQRLQFVVADHFGKVHSIAEYQDDVESSALNLLKEVFSAEEIIRRSYLNTHMVLCRNQSLIQPKIMGEQPTDLTNYFLKPSSSRTKISECIEVANANNLYTIDSNLKAYAERVLTNIHLHHIHSLLIQWCHSLVSNLPGDRIFGFLDNDQLTIVYFKDCKFQYINRFDIKGETDILYYFLLIYKQFNLNKKECQLSLHGMDQSKANGLLGVHIDNIQILRTSGENREMDPYFPLLSAVDILKSLSIAQS